MGETRAERERLEHAPVRDLSRRELWEAQARRLIDGRMLRAELERRQREARVFGLERVGP